MSVHEDRMNCSMNHCIGWRIVWRTGTIRRAAIAGIDRYRYGKQFSRISGKNMASVVLLVRCEYR